MDTLWVLKSMRFEKSCQNTNEEGKDKGKIKNIEKFQSKTVVVDSNFFFRGMLVSHEKYAFVNAIQVMNGAIA